VQGALTELARLSAEASSRPQASAAMLAKVSSNLAQQLRTESSTFRSTDVAEIVSACCRLALLNPPLLEVVATHVLRGMLAYPPFALCNIPNGFARLRHHHRQLFDAIASFLVSSSQVEQLSPVDVACLLYAYAECRHSAGALLEACSRRLKSCYLEIGSHNCATILNSYARLSECNPELFRVLSYSLLQTGPESFEVHHISVIMNSFAKCRIRQPRLMQLLSGYLDGRVQMLSPQNVSNIVHACAMLGVYNHQLLFEIQGRVLGEDLKKYKLFELAMLVHGLAKLQCGAPKIYATLFDELARRRDWDPQVVAQVLDAMRRRRACYQDALVQLLLCHFLERLGDYGVHPLTQAAWCILELGILNTASNMPPRLLPLDGEDTAIRHVMRLVLGRMRELHEALPFTPTQRHHIQHLIRSYHYKHEVDYNLQPQQLKTFCRGLFDVSTSVVSSVARRRLQA